MSGVSQSRVDGGTFAFGSLVNCLVQLPNKRRHTEKSKGLKKYCFINFYFVRQIRYEVIMNRSTPPYPPLIGEGKGEVRESSDLRNQYAVFIYKWPAYCENPILLATFF